MKVGVIGSGEVAKALAEGFVKHGYGVTIGSRTPSKLADWAAELPRDTNGELCGGSGVWRGGGIWRWRATSAMDALKLAGAENLKGKPVLDACNPIEEAAPVNGVLKLYTGG